VTVTPVTATSPSDDNVGRVTSAVELSWIPLGAGSPVVQASGRLFERLSARLQHRSACDLYHAALVVRLPSGRYAIEQAPVPDFDGAARGVVAVGPVGLRGLGRWRVFRYEVRCWRDGIIPDLGDAVDSPVALSDDTVLGERIVEVLPQIPTPVWGRDEAGLGEMWNSNSVIAWALTASGIGARTLHAPAGGRAPGWLAGCTAAERTQSSRARQ
jgi:hypothetical protein